MATCRTAIITAITRTREADDETPPVPDSGILAADHVDLGGGTGSLGTAALAGVGGVCRGGTAVGDCGAQGQYVADGRARRTDGSRESDGGARACRVARGESGPEPRLCVGVATRPAGGAV